MFRLDKKKLNIQKEDSAAGTKVTHNKQTEVDLNQENASAIKNKSWSVSDPVIPRIGVTCAKFVNEVFNEKIYKYPITKPFQIANVRNLTK